MHIIFIMEIELQKINELMDDLEKPDLFEERRKTLNAIVELALLLKEFPDIAMMHNSTKYQKERERYLALRIGIPEEFTNHFLRQVAYQEFEVF